MQTVKFQSNDNVDRHAGKARIFFEPMRNFIEFDVAERVDRRDGASVL